MHTFLNFKKIIDICNHIIDIFFEKIIRSMIKRTILVSTVTYIANLWANFNVYKLNSCIVQYNSMNTNIVYR